MTSCAINFDRPIYGNTQMKVEIEICGVRHWRENSRIISKPMDGKSIKINEGS